MVDEAVFRALDRLPEAVLAADDRRRYVLANDAACALAGMPREQLLGTTIEDHAAIPRSRVESMWRELLTQGVLEGRIALRHPEKRVLDVEFRARARFVPGVHVAVLRGPSRTAAIESANPNRISQLLEMQDALLAPETSLDAVMQMICERAVSLAGAEGSTVEMHEGDDLVYRAVAGSTSRFAGFRVKVGSSLSGRALASGQVLICEDSEIDERVDREACRAVGARSMIVAPLVHGGNVVGVLKVTSAQASAFDSQVVDVLRLLSGFLGAAMVRAAAQDAREAHVRIERERILELERVREELSSLLVHDLRSPLAAVVANLQFLRKAVPDTSPDAINAAVDALAATRRLDGLIRVLLDVARIEQKQLPMQRSVVHPAAIADEVIVERVREATLRKVHVMQKIDPTHSVYADPNLFRRVLDNVVDNALRHTPAGGRIELWCVAAGDDLEIRIGNEGAAIPVELRERLFDKFAQAKKNGSANFGLGLYFCRLVMEEHGGRIWIESTEALPTVFAMRLRAKPSAA